MSQIAVELPSKSQFLENLDSDFRATLEDGRTFDLHLFKVETTISTSVQEAFSMLFRAPLDTPAEQGTFHLEHGILGGLDLFLVPIKQKEDALIFEAVFNRILY